MKREKEKIEWLHRQRQEREGRAGGGGEMFKRERVGRERDA